jgi:hypothetical protein
MASEAEASLAKGQAIQSGPAPPRDRFVALLLAMMKVGRLPANRSAG